MVISKKHTLSFIILTFSLSWLYVFWVLNNPQTQSLYVFVMLIPAIVGIGINIIKYKSIKSVFIPITQKFKLKAILFPIAYPIILLAFIGIASLSLGITEVDKSKIPNLWHLPGLIQIIIAFVLLFGEEYGWRGFLLNNLTGSVLRKTTTVGLIWAIWHAPIIFKLAQLHDFNNPLLLAVIQLLAVFVITFPFTYSYLCSNNIITPIIFHFIWNLYNPILLGSIYSQTSGVFNGSLIIINGETIAGIVCGIPFIIWFIKLYLNKKLINYV